MRRVSVPLSALLLTILLLAPPLAARAECPGGVPGEPAVNVELFFGRSMKDGGTVDADAWADFLANSVTPRFPDGLTVLDGNGQWRQRTTGKLVAEPSTVVVIVTENTAENWARFQAIRDEYKARFGQEAVGLVSSPACASW